MGASSWLHWHSPWGIAPSWSSACQSFIVEFYCWRLRTALQLIMPFAKGRAHASEHSWKSFLVLPPWRRQYPSRLSFFCGNYYPNWIIHLDPPMENILLQYRIPFYSLPNDNKFNNFPELNTASLGIGKERRHFPPSRWGPLRLSLSKHALNDIIDRSLKGKVRILCQFVVVILFQTRWLGLKNPCSPYIQLFHFQN